MKEIKLTQGKFAVVDDNIYEELNQYKWHVSKNYNTFYAVRNEGKFPHQKKIRMHRLIMGVTDEKIQIDHKYGNGLDNRKENLRICTSAENQRNKKPQIGRTSKFKGVYFSKPKNKWRARIGINSKLTHLGYFTNEVEAAKTYDKAAKIHFKEFANLNFKIT